MRAALLAAVICLLGACGDADGPLLFSDDVAPQTRVDGCVVDDGGDLVTHRVARGETLTSIAREIYGDAALWREIAAANPDAVRPDGHVDAGALLIIPFAGN